MEDQIPPSQPPIQQTLENQITPEMLAEMKARARELAVRQAAQQSMAQLAQGAPTVQQQLQQPQVVYVRRNLTVAELLLVLLLSCGIVTGIQLIWRGLSEVLPRVEVRVR